MCVQMCALELEILRQRRFTGLVVWMLVLLKMLESIASTTLVIIWKLSKSWYQWLNTGMSAFQLCGLLSLITQKAQLSYFTYQSFLPITFRKGCGWTSNFYSKWYLPHLFVVCVVMIMILNSYISDWFVAVEICVSIALTWPLPYSNNFPCAECGFQRVSEWVICYSLHIVAVPLIMWAYSL